MSTTAFGGTVWVDLSGRVAVAHTLATGPDTEPATDCSTAITAGGLVLTAAAARAEHRARFCTACHIARTKGKAPR